MSVFVNSNFPDILSSDVEYTVSFLFKNEERIHGNLKYKFSEESIVKRSSKKEEAITIFYTDTDFSFVLSGYGTYKFSLFLDDEMIYEKEFIVEKILDYQETEMLVQCILKPSCVNYKKEGKKISFSYGETNLEELVRYYLQNTIKKNQKVYCGLRYYAPDLSTHWRIITQGKSYKQDSNYIEFTPYDGNHVDWYFPMTDSSFCMEKKEYTQSVGFYKKIGNEYVEILHEEFQIKLQNL